MGGTLCVLDLDTGIGPVLSQQHLAARSTRTMLNNFYLNKKIKNVTRKKTFHLKSKSVSDAAQKIKPTHISLSSDSFFICDTCTVCFNTLMPS